MRNWVVWTDCVYIFLSETPKISSYTLHGEKNLFSFLTRYCHHCCTFFKVWLKREGVILYRSSTWWPKVWFWMWYWPRETQISSLLMRGIGPKRHILLQLKRLVWCPEYHLSSFFFFLINHAINRNCLLELKAVWACACGAKYRLAWSRSFLCLVGLQWSAGSVWFN